MITLNNNRYGLRNIRKSTTKIIGDFIILRFFKTAIGEVIIRQTFEENGRPEENEYLIEIRQGNCLAVFINVYQVGAKFFQKFYFYFENTKKIEERLSTGTLFPDEVVAVKLNMAVENAKILLPYFLRDQEKNKYPINLYYDE